MPMIYVKPAPGGRVRMPERHSRVMPEQGAFVPRIDYYERLLISGDVVLYIGGEKIEVAVASTDSENDVASNLATAIGAGYVKLVALYHSRLRPRLRPMLSR